MARRRKGRPVSGILVLDKPAGKSSNGAMVVCRAIYNASKAGHTGALDPLATGVLPICFGEATKFSQFLLDADKGYLSTFVFGERRTTGDAEGEPLEENDASTLIAADVEAAMQGLRGTISQVPPMYSALKRDGKPLYQLARQGIEVEREARDVEISRFELLDFRPGRRAEADVVVQCSKGTYIRSLAEDLGAALGTGAYVGQLRRSAAGPFSLDQAHSIDAIQALRDRQAFAELDELLLPVDAGLEHIPLCHLGETAAHYLSQGQTVQVPSAPLHGPVRLAGPDGHFMGIGGILDDGRVAPKRLISGAS